MNRFNIFRGITFLADRYVIIEKNQTRLIIQTDSGRKIAFLSIVIISLFQDFYIAMIINILVFIFWSYEKIWHVDEINKIVRSESRIIFLTLKSKILNSVNLKKINIKRITGGDTEGYNYVLQFIDLNGKVYKITRKSRCKDLIPIIKDITLYISHLEVVEHEDCKKEQSFISFE